MKNLFIFIMVIFLVLSTSFAQDTTSAAEKLMLYETAKKSGSTAVILSCLLSSTGHAYAGNWGRGLLFTLGRIGFGVLALTAGTETKTQQVTYYYVEQKTEYTPAYYIGMIGVTVLAIWEMADAYNEVKKYNARLLEQIMGKKTTFSLNFTPVNNKNGDILPGFKVSYQF